MRLDRIELNGLPQEGLVLHVDDQEIWRKPIERYQVKCILSSPVAAEASLFAQKDGCLVRGRIEGRVTMPCNRCMEPTEIGISHAFEEFEEYRPSSEEDEDVLGSDVLKIEDGVPVLDLAALLWEEFSLSLPVKPLCRKDCRGLCPQCGRNLNEGACSCSRDSGDPRLAVLRQLKVKH